MIYADQAATSFPKPPEVVEAVCEILRRVPGSPGRSGHRGALAAGRVVFEAREELAQFFSLEDESRFVFTSGATEGLNLVIQGVLRPGDVALASAVEHNSVARPLEALCRQGRIRVHYVPCNREGFLDLRALKEMVKTFSPRLICLSHVSNVLGTIQPLEEIVPLKGEALILIDAAQSVGHIDIDLSQLAIDFLAFSGHKGLLSPGGIGALYLRPGVEEILRPLKFGGTGSRSESLEQPDFLPDRFESGTPNLPGIAGLAAGARVVRQIGLKNISSHERLLAETFIELIKKNPKIRIYGPKDRTKATGIISVNIEGLPPSEVARRLDREFGVMVRPGLHCAPLAHKTLDTLPQGTVRFSFNYFNRLSEVERAAQALLEIAS